MSHLFKLIQTDDTGTDTLDLNDRTNYRLIQYSPNVGDGKTVIDNVTLDIYGSSISNLQTNINNLQRYVDQAGRHGNQLRGKRVYAQFAVEGMGTANPYRSELLTDGTEAARLVMDRNVLNRGYYNVPRVRANLIFNRQDWWETNDATVLNGGYNQNVTSPSYPSYSVYNCNDGGTIGSEKRNNYIWFPGTLFAGDLPSPLEFYITQVSGTTDTLYLCGNIYNAGTATTNFQHYYEAEAGTAYIGGTVSSDSAYSGGAYKSFTWTGATTSFVKTAGWTIDDDQVIAMQGGFIRVLGMLKVATNLSTVTIQMRFVQNGITVAYGTEEQLNATDLLQNFGYLRTPPYLVAAGYNLLAGGTLELWVRDTAGAGLMYLDFIQLNMNDDGYLTAKSQISNIVPSSTYNLSESYDYIVTASGKYGGIIKNGSIMAIPGKGLFLTALSSGGINTSWSIMPFYRPRRRSVL